MQRLSSVSYLSKENKFHILKKKKIKRVFSIVIIILLIVINGILYVFSPITIFFSIRNIILGVMTGVFVFFVNFSITYLITFFRKKINRSAKFINNLSILDLDLISFSLIQTFLVITLLASVEEFIFRSFLLSFFNRLFSPLISIAVNALLFYLFHFNKKVIELMFMAIVFSAITLYSNNLLSVIVAHSLNNIMVYVYKKYLFSKTKVDIIE